MSDLYEKFINRLIKANDENVSEEEHISRLDALRNWRDGVVDAGGIFLNGDYYYIEKADNSEIKERPMCAGVFLDWKSNIE